MTEAQIKLKRTESLLAELIPEALGSLNDKRLHEIDVLEVKCSRGKSDAKVYLDPKDLDEQDIKALTIEQVKDIIKNQPVGRGGRKAAPKKTTAAKKSTTKKTAAKKPVAKKKATTAKKTTTIKKSVAKDKE